MPIRENTKLKMIRARVITFLMLAVILLLSYHLTVGQYGFINMMELEDQIADLKAEELKLNTELVDLEVKRDRLKTDSLYIEKLARQNYHLSRPGEKVVN